MSDDANDTPSADAASATVLALAAKRLLAAQLEAAMREAGISKRTLARRMRTSRSALDRLLDPGNRSLTLATLARAAAALGKGLRIDLE